MCDQGAEMCDQAQLRHVVFLRCFDRLGFFFYSCSDIVVKARGIIFSLKSRDKSKKSVMRKQSILWKYVAFNMSLFIFTIKVTIFF